MQNFSIFGNKIAKHRIEVCFAVAINQIQCKNRINDRKIYNYVQTKNLIQIWSFDTDFTSICPARKDFLEMLKSKTNVVFHHFTSLR